MDKKDTLEDQLTLEYYGPPTKMGRMNSYDVAGYIIAFSDFLGTTSRRVYGEKINIRTEIEGFKGDSFDISFALSIFFVTANLFSGTPLTPKDLISLIKECIGAWIHLRGVPPKALFPDKECNNKNNFRVENQNGQIIYVNADTVNIITDQKAGKAVEGFIRKPLESGISHMRINSKSSAEVAKIEEKDASSFGPIDIEKKLLESEMKMNLLIESPTFKEGNKWKFWDGSNSFFADILDQEFINRVDSGAERFGKGDRLIAQIRFTQSGTAGSLSMDRAIIKVLDHEIGVESPNKLL